MLFSFRKGACVLAAALSLGASATLAQDDQSTVHPVLIVDGGFFPQILFVNPGDTIRFTNDSHGAHRLYGPEESWQSDNIRPDDSFELVLTETTPLTYQGMWPPGQVTEEALPEGTLMGEISYADPTLEEDAALHDEEYVN